MRKVIVSDRSHSRFFKRDFARGAAIKRFAALMGPKAKRSELERGEETVIVIIRNSKAHG